MLSCEGYDVQIARDASTALNVLEKNTFEMVICDIGLPDMDGYALIKRIHQLNSIPAIALSGFDEDVRENVDGDFVKHFLKPVNFQDISAVISRILAGT